MLATVIQVEIPQQQVMIRGQFTAGGQMMEDFGTKCSCCMVQGLILDSEDHVCSM